MSWDQITVAACQFEHKDGDKTFNLGKIITAATIAK
jgi:hypothetical protein